MSDMTPDRLARINLALMIADTKNALVEAAEQDRPAVLQAGILFGLSAAGRILDGATADEAWASIEPLVQRLRQDPHHGGSDE